MCKRATWVTSRCFVSLILALGYLLSRIENNVSRQWALDSSARESKGLLDHALYINLESRADRRASIESELRKANISAERIEAVHISVRDPVLAGCWNESFAFTCAGRIGCQRSHIKALEYASAKKWPHVAIFEDDFQWVPGVDAERVLANLEQIQRWRPDWDVIVLSLNVMEKEIFEKNVVKVGRKMTASLVRVDNALATHGYLIRSRLYPFAIQMFRLCDVRSNLHAAIDVCWQPLQRLTKWYGFTPQLATQAISYSDIEGTEVSYSIV
mmetsp:Transcript_4314/g.15203  ORF Transcript_4314/g.15203 Transcript_4314/m.15203 type:complete len:271 (-) Transcript_4314:399-1211(-)